MLLTNSTISKPLLGDNTDVVSGVAVDKMYVIYHIPRSLQLSRQLDPDFLEAPDLRLLQSR